MRPEGFQSNHAGGILGGISSGQEIVVGLALKPTSSIMVPGETIDKQGNAVEMVTVVAMILVLAFVRYQLPKQCWHGADGSSATSSWPEF